MTDDYLWDGSGPPDPEVQRLETLLGRLRSTPPLPALPAVSWRWRTARYLAPALAAAATIALMVGLTLRTAREGTSLEIASVKGRPQIGAVAVAAAGRFGVGQTLVTESTPNVSLVLTFSRTRSLFGIENRL